MAHVSTHSVCQVGVTTDIEGVSCRRLMVGTNAQSRGAAQRCDTCHRGESARRARRSKGPHVGRERLRCLARRVGPSVVVVIDKYARQHDLQQAQQAQHGARILDDVTGAACPPAALHAAYTSPICSFHRCTFADPSHCTRTHAHTHTKRLLASQLKS